WPRPAASPARPRAPPRPAPRRPSPASSLPHPSMSGKDEHERAQPQDRGEKEGETAHVVPKRLEQKPQEPDIDGNDSLGEIEGATEREREPHDQAGHDEERGEPDTPVQLAAEAAGDEPDDEEMVWPLGPEQGEFHLDVREVRGEEEEAQEKDVVEGHVRGGDRSPREGGRGASHPDQAGDCREGDAARDGPRPDVLAV